MPSVFAKYYNFKTRMMLKIRMKSSSSINIEFFTLFLKAPECTCDFFLRLSEKCWIAGVNKRNPGQDIAVAVFACFYLMLRGNLQLQLSF